jgi:hypothetical protein
MFSPNPAPSTAGSGYTRARTPLGGMTQTALSAMFPTATSDDHRGADGDGARVTEFNIAIANAPKVQRQWDRQNNGFVYYTRTHRILRNAAMADGSGHLTAVCSHPDTHKKCTVWHDDVCPM